MAQMLGLNPNGATPVREKSIVRALSMLASTASEIEAQISSLYSSLAGVLQNVPEAPPSNERSQRAGPPLIVSIDEITEQLAKQLHRIRDIEQRLEV